MVAILVVLTILLFIGAEFLWERRRKGQEADQPALVPVPPLAYEPSLPSGLFVHPGHTWVEIQRSGMVRVGLDDFVRHALGRPDRLILRRSGELICRGDPLLTLERNRRQLVLTAPLSGVIVASNENLSTRPEALGRTAYGENWAYVLRPSRLGEEIGGLQVAERASRWLSAELQRLADWLDNLVPARPGIAMQDGGLPVFSLLNQVDDHTWQAFQTTFLSRVENV